MDQHQTNCYLFIRLNDRSIKLEYSPLIPVATYNPVVLHRKGNDFNETFTAKLVLSCFVCDHPSVFHILK